MHYPVTSVIRSGLSLLLLSVFLVILPQTSRAGTLTVVTAGSGSGVVNDSGLIQCESGIAANCSGVFNDGVDEINLSAIADIYSVFEGWSAPCTGSGTGPCVFTINGDTEVTATFSSTYHAKILGMSTQEYTTLTGAYAAATEDIQLAAHVHTFIEDLTLDREIVVTFLGGMGGLYLTNSGFTTLQGALEIQQGSLEVDSLIIQ